MTLDYLPSSRKPRRSLLARIVWVVFALALAYGIIFVAGRASNATISVFNRITRSTFSVDGPKPSVTPIADDPEYAMPENDSGRLDILLLGMRGKDDPVNGGLLTDTILLFSLDTKTGAAALTSIPRDLTVRITDDRTAKINEAYAHYGIAGTKKLYSRILGIGIDNIVVVDFDAFQSVVNDLGGVSITLDRPFEELQQWGASFSLPAGVNELNGEQALYYARSRYSTSDFDRSRRQMQIIMAIKQKAVALSLTKDPIKLLELVSAVRKHLETDLNVFDLGTIKNLIAQQDKLDKIKRYQLTTENVLYETMANGTYELLPRDNTLAHVKRFLQTVLTGSPILPTPAPSETSPRATTLSATTTPTP